jgi:tetratricopeptide (TPR) repeat protein
VFSPDGTRIAAWYSLNGISVFRVWTAPKDTLSWQAERRQALNESVLPWHRAQAAEAEGGGQWFAAVFHLDRLIRAEPEHGPHHLRRAAALAKQGKGDEAKPDFEKATALNAGLPSPVTVAALADLDQWELLGKLHATAVMAPDASFDTWQHHALIRLQLDDREGYRKACALMLERFGWSKDYRVLGNVARPFSWGPEALSDLTPAVKLAQSFVHPNVKNADARTNLGAVLYRAKQDQEAITELNEAIKLRGTGGTALECLFMAMAHHRLEHADEAKKWFDRAVQAIDKEPPSLWNQRLELQLLRREAAQLLEEKPGDGPKPSK